jgi:hypothetical protein
VGETEASATGSIPVSPGLGLQQAPGRRRGHESPPLAASVTAVRAGGTSRTACLWGCSPSAQTPTNSPRGSQEMPRRLPGDSQGPYHAVGLRCRTPQVANLRRGPRPYGILIFNSKIRFRRFSAPRAPRRPNGPAPAVGLVGRLDSSKSGSLPPAPRPFHGYELLPCLPMSLTRQTPSWMGRRTASSFSTGSIPFCGSWPGLFRLT